MVKKAAKTTVFLGISELILQPWGSIHALIFCLSKHNNADHSHHKRLDPGGNATCAHVHHAIYVIPTYTFKCNTHCLSPCHVTVIRQALVTQGNLLNSLAPEFWLDPSQADQTPRAYNLARQAYCRCVSRRFLQGQIARGENTKITPPYRPVVPCTVISPTASSMPRRSSHLAQGCKIRPVLNATIKAKAGK